MILKQLLNTQSLVVRIILATIMLGANSSCTEKDIQPSDLLILIPGKGEIYYTGTNIRLTWSAPLAKHVSLELFQGSEQIYTIAKDVLNSSVFDWKIPADIPKGTGSDAQLGGYQNNCVGNKFGHKVWESHIWSSDCTREGKQIVRVIVNSSGKISRVATICHNASSVRYIKDSKAD